MYIYCVYRDDSSFANMSIYLRFYFQFNFGHSYQSDCMFTINMYIPKILPRNIVCYSKTFWPFHRCL